MNLSDYKTDDLFNLQSECRKSIEIASEHNDNYLLELGQYHFNNIGSEILKRLNK